MSALAKSHGNGFLKLTTRQAFQLHGVIKKKLKPTIQVCPSSCMHAPYAPWPMSENMSVYTENM